MSSKKKSPLKQTFGGIADILRYNQIQAAESNPDMLSRGISAAGDLFGQVDYDKLLKKLKNKEKEGQQQEGQQQEGQQQEGQQQIENQNVEALTFGKTQAQLDKEFLDRKNRLATESPVNRLPSYTLDLDRPDVTPEEMYGAYDLDEVNTISPREDKISDKEKEENPILRRHYSKHYGDSPLARKRPQTNRVTPLLRMTSPLSQTDLAAYGGIPEAQFDVNDDVFTQAALRGYNKQVRKHNYKRQVWAEQQKQLGEEFAKFQVDPSGVNTFDQSIFNVSRGLKKELLQLRRSKGNMDPFEYTEAEDRIFAKVGQMKNTSKRLAEIMVDYKTNEGNISMSTDPKAMDMINTLMNGGQGLSIENIDGVLTLRGFTSGQEGLKKELDHKLKQGIISRKEYNRELDELGNDGVNIALSDITAGKGPFHYNKKVNTNEKMHQIAKDLSDIKGDFATPEGKRFGSRPFEYVKDLAKDKINGILADDSVVRSIAADRFGLDKQEYDMKFARRDANGQLMYDKDGEFIIDTNASKEFVADALMENLEQVYTPYETANKAVTNPHLTQQIQLEKLAMERAKLNRPASGGKPTEAQIKSDQSRQVLSNAINTGNYESLVGLGNITEVKPDKSWGTPTGVYKFRDKWNNQIEVDTKNPSDPNWQALQNLLGIRTYPGQQAFNAGGQGPITQPTGGGTGDEGGNNALNFNLRAQEILKNRGKTPGGNQGQIGNRGQIGNQNPQVPAKSPSFDPYNIERPVILNPNQITDTHRAKQEKIKFNKVYGISFNNYEKLKTLTPEKRTQLDQIAQEYQKQKGIVNEWSKESKVGKKAIKQMSELKDQFKKIAPLTGNFFNPETMFDEYQKFKQMGDVAPFANPEAGRQKKANIEQTKAVINNYHRETGNWLSVPYRNKLLSIVEANGSEWLDTIPKPGEATKKEIQQYIDKAFNQIK